jgi:hypothetical protein
MRVKLTAVLLVAGSFGAACAQNAATPWLGQSSSSSQAQSNAEAKQSVQFLYPEQVQLHAGKPDVVDLHFKVADGLHINSHTPKEKSFIRTELQVAEPPGVTFSAVDFPPGEDYAFAFNPGEKLSVYTGEFVLHAHVKASSGEHLVQAALRYQACDSNSCYPPKKIPVAIDIIAK